MNRKIGVIIVAAALVPATVHAAASGDEARHASPAAATAAPLSTGEVRKIDRDAKKITIRHGPLENLGMPPMTMVFQVSDPALLEQAKAGDKIRFLAEKRDGTYTVTHLELQ